MEENIKQSNSLMSLLWRGCAMGIAEVIPGVSGGTIAFITGIYERLLKSISQISPKLISVLIKQGFSAFAKQLDLFFLIQLFTGMLIGIIVGVSLVTKLLVSAPAVLWAFFFGLIAASVIYMLRQVEDKNTIGWMSFVLSVVLSYMIVNISPVSGNESYLYIFVCGAIAISALILPGISGSFMLLLLGMYTFIVPKVKAILTEFDFTGFPEVLCFCLGCLFGLMAFSRVLKYTFENYRDQVIMILSGLMLGTLPKIWPWRNPNMVIDKISGEVISTETFLSDPLNDTYKLISENNVLPSDYLGDPMVLVAVTSILIGFGLVIASIFIDTKKL